MSEPQHACVRCGGRVHNPLTACRDCRMVDRDGCEALVNRLQAAQARRAERAARYLRPNVKPAPQGYTLNLPMGSPEPTLTRSTR